MSETLSAAWDECQNMCDTWVYETLGAEFDRLTAELETSKLDYELMCDDYKQLQIDILNVRERNNNLTAELSRYREALERIVKKDYHSITNNTHGMFGWIAKQALGG